MITKEFDYTADRFDAEIPQQMATLRWSVLEEDGCYHTRSLRMPHDGLNAAERKALEVMRSAYPDAELSVRRVFHNGRFYSSFLVDAK